MPARDPAGRVEHEHRVVLDAVEHQLDAGLDLAQAAVGGRAFLLAPFGDELGVVERGPGVAGHLRQHREVVFRKERPAPLGDHDDAPGVSGRTNRRNQHAFAIGPNRARDLRFALGREPIDRHALVERPVHEPLSPSDLTPEERPVAGGRDLHRFRRAGEVGARQT